MSVSYFGRCVVAALLGFCLPLSAQAASSLSLGVPDPAICLAQPPLSGDVDVDSPGRWNNPNRPGTGWELSYNEDKTTVEAIWYSFAALPKTGSQNG